MRGAIIGVAIIGALAQVTAQQDGCILSSESCTNGDTCCYADELGAMCEETSGVCCLPEEAPCTSEADCCGGSLCADGICGGEFTYTAPAGIIEGVDEELTVSFVVERSAYGEGDVYVSKVTGPTPDGETLEVLLDQEGTLISVIVDGEPFTTTDTDMARRLRADRDSKLISTPANWLQVSSGHRRLNRDVCAIIIDIVCGLRDLFCSTVGRLSRKGRYICSIISLSLCSNRNAVINQCVRIFCKGDPHLVGFNGQKFSFTGTDGDWYALLHDDTMHINMRVTMPDSAKSGVSFITGLGASLVGSDGELHQALIAVDNPNDVSGGRSCPEGATGPCLANGELSMMLDGEATVKPGEYDLGGGVFVSAMNLPDACQHRAFHSMELTEDQSSDVAVLPGKRNLRIPFPPGQWILANTRLAGAKECYEYVKLATWGSSFYDLQSRHASVQITTPYLTLRITHAKIVMKNKPYPGAPDHMTYRMDLAFEHVHLGSNPQGVLGTTTRVRKNEAHKDILRGHGVIPGSEEAYRVPEPLTTGFDFDLV